MSCETTPTYDQRSTANSKLKDAIGGFAIKYSGGCTGYSQIQVYFHDGFRTDCNDWAGNLNFYSSTYGGLSIDWIGHVGTYRSTDGDPSWHYKCRAWDISRIQWTDGTKLDICTGAHNSSSRTTRRRYLAVDAVLRRYFYTVLDGYYNAAHATHFHCDDGCTLAPLNTGLSSSTFFMQKVCNDFNGENLVVDGIWGPLTEDAYQNLIRALCMTCIDPKASTTDYQTFLGYIARHGFADKSAGYYTYGCFPCPQLRGDVEP